ncbi:helix-turn-helix domain-containing protein [Staphylococcus felis]|uniref:helix-turn-helix domain-containing protein n=1 Tax=Staphylococcus felis TaxID=46127 RepID=UPI000CD29D78|nr:helix-turn-helix domain-containing protein [Staphylococcus felis]AVP37476.1 hypothetical protein C7J90_11100 [Staphylococcus felis]PNZ34100.1 hypothetical protein CD143_10020 [Staphylococcus felis]QQB02575.1 helix-turn-helix domain-containing protein [Staphylococcus felis]
MNERKPFVMIPKTLAGDSSVDSKTKGIYLCLALLCNDQTKSGRPSRKKIAELAGVSNSTLGRHLKILERKNYIKIEQRFDKKDGCKITNRYTLNDV